MGNLFSSFDPQARLFFLNLGFNWLARIFAALAIPQVYWMVRGQARACVASVLSLLIAELRSIFGGLVVPGTFILFLAFFFFILRLNFMGLFPYVFTPSRHFVFTLTLALPLWLGSILWSLAFQFNAVIAHLVPIGTPGGLMPVIVLIETVSSLIRPLTLAIRLAANMVAGHLLLTLLGSQGTVNLSRVMPLLLTSLVLLLVLECAVACIQSYVFTILRSLYLNELMGAEFSKKFI